MVTKSPKVRYTYEDYCQLPDDRRYELIDGEFYEMAPAPTPTHQWAALTLTILMVDFVRSRRLGVVYIAPLDVILAENDTMQPDILFVAAGREGIITQRACEGPPDLVVEVLSPSTARRDLGIKMRRYARFGVREYWVVYPVARSIEVLVLRDGKFVSLGVYVGEMSPDSEVMPGLVFAVSSIFPVG